MPVVEFMEVIVHLNNGISIIYPRLDRGIWGMGAVERCERIRNTLITLVN